MRAVLASINNNQEKSAASTLNMEKSQSHEKSGEDPYVFVATSGAMVEPMKDYTDDGYRQ